MKKLALIIAAMMTVAFVAPAFAADNLSLSGSFQVRGWDVNAEDAADDASYFDQRMRVQAKITASDNAYVVIRADMGDAQWGSATGFNGVIQRPGRTTNSEQIDFDRLYGHFEQDNWALTIGQQYLGLGILEVLDANMVAAKVRLKFGAIEPSLIYGKISENGSTNDDGAFDDSDLYAINVSFDVAGFDSNVFYAMADDDGAADTTAWALGFHTAGKLGMVGLVAELSFLGGDAAANVDYEGTQFYLKADSDLNDALNVGAEFLWAAGENEADEQQLTNLADFGDFTIADTNAPCATDVVVVGTNGPFDFTDDNAGVVGASLFGSYKVSADLSFGGKFAYLTPEEDAATDVDSLMSTTVWAGYNLGSNTSLVLLYNIANAEFDTGAADEDVKTLYARFLISF